VERAMTKTLRTILSVFILISAILAVSGVSWSQRTEINPLSATSLSLKIFHDDTVIGVATGFILEKNNNHYLVTNRHVALLCGQDPSLENVGGWICANKLAILHYQIVNQGMNWFWVTEDILDAHGKPRWLEHPTLKGRADLIALPLVHTENVRFYPVDLELRKADILVSPGDSVSIVGFPFGMTQDTTLGLPIWKTGTVASDPDVNFSGRPMFLVDTTSRQGMSGSPAYIARTGTYRSSKALMMGAATKFLGVYSEQNVTAEIGAVWKAEVVATLYDSLP
jgi:hypothetical protein